MGRRMRHEAKRSRKYTEAQYRAERKARVHAKRERRGLGGDAERAHESDGQTDTLGGTEHDEETKDHAQASTDALRG